MCNTAEHIYRAVRPKSIYLRPDGSIAAAAFKDKKGASVEIQLGRNDDDVRIHMSRLSGNLAKIPVAVCDKANVEIFYDDSPNKYHRLLLNKKRESDNDKILTPLQAEELADGIIAVFQLDNKK